MKNGDSVGVAVADQDGQEAFIQGTFIGAFGDLFCEVELPGVQRPERLMIESTQVRPWEDVPEAQRRAGWRLAQTEG